MLMITWNPDSDQIVKSDPVCNIQFQNQSDFKSNCKPKTRKTKLIPTPAIMATVSITSDLESYLASLRSYLADDNRQTPEEKENEAAEDTQQTQANGVQKKRTKQRDDGKQSSKIGNTVRARG